MPQLFILTGRQWDARKEYLMIILSHASSSSFWTYMLRA